MGFKAFDYSVALIGFEKNGLDYGMACAWAMQVDYDKLVCLLGAQSVTGHNIEVGDIIGVSTASKDQKDIALALGEGHSGKESKFKGIKTIKNGSAILIDKASRQMVCEVIDVLHLKGIESDNLVYLKILNYTEDNDNFLHYSDL